ncbi:MAG TPA: ATP-binding protein [Povalibacter sp.]|uniref:ATP-binding protein n=1 Tax=Povalibacter sp. TaxID=1962978 RepID=UPI002C81564F|nr:ATP-binding protein [Povalibacter sp.]HMN46026.1 ATP-binding protein [Povalibacter sp.]
MDPQRPSSSDEGSDLFIGGGPLAEHMRRCDWRATSIGAPGDWPQSLRSMVRILLTSRYQMWMGWGRDLAFFYNDAYRPTLGEKHPWALGQPASVVWREIWPEVGPLVDQVMTTGEATYNEGMLLFLERSGFSEETYHTFSYSPLFDDDGSIAGLLCVVVEETERVIGARRLATLRKLASALSQTSAQAQLFRAVQDELGDNLQDLPFTAVYLFDDESDSATLVASSGIDAGHPAAPLEIETGRHPWALGAIQGTDSVVVVPDLGEKFAAVPSGAWQLRPNAALLAPIAEPGATRAAGFLVAAANPHRRVDNGYRDFVSLLAGQIAGALANARGFEQERKRAEALAAIDHAKTTFFSNVSHEFRTPLTLMLGPLEELLATPAFSEEMARTQAQVAHRNGMRLLRLVNSLLDFARLEAGRMNAFYEPVDLASFSAEIASSFRSAIEKAGLALTVDARALPERVHVDPDLWEKVLLNLLSNAFKFTLNGGITLTVDTTTDRRNAVVCVTDTGIGVPETEIPRLFERFHRVEGAQGRSFEGSGIGLALVQQLVRLHGGDVSVRSELGRGTTFSVSLPFGTAHLPADKLRQERSGPTAVKALPFVEEALRWVHEAPDIAPPQTTPSHQPSRRILLADDNADMRDYVTRLLGTQGYLVETAVDGQQALQRARAGNFDLILADVMMPNLDGFGLLRAIRSDARLASIPVIMLSARAADEAKSEGIEAGADDYLVKPFVARELLARIHTNIEMAAIRRDAARAIMQSEQQRLISQERLSRALATGRVAVYEWNVSTDRLSIYGQLADAFGVGIEAAADGLPLATFFEGVHPDDRERTAALVTKTVETGAPFEAEYRVLAADGPRTVLSRGQIETLPSGERNFTGVLIDLTQEKAAEAQMREQQRALEVLNRVAAIIAGELKTESVVQAITDAGVELIGAQFGAFFYNVIDAAGERYTLYTLSGAAPESFAKFPMPRKTAVFGPTFDGVGVVRADDITRDPRYGRSEPYRGMPPGHLPVRSYLAVPVKSTSGEVLGGLFFGHAQTGRFGAETEELILGLAASAAVAMENARLVQAAQRELVQRRRAENELQLLNATLEKRVRDEVAERTRAEEALRQAQKMEAVGQLTGGVAHDFNNLLTVIIGGLDTIRRSSPATDEARIRRAADMALQGAQRAAHLTSRLLAFSRRQPLDPKPLDLNVLVRDMTELLHRTLGETIELEGILAPRLWLAEVDQNQIESAIVNLAVNARDAMENGGKLTIETANTDLDERYAATDAEVIPGQYVMVAVSDTGSGMSQDVLARAFEPFFTTKDVGRGTGLGLSMVYGFVKQSGGHVTIYSEVGQGTTVKLYFPRYHGGAPVVAPVPSVEVPRASREEVILVVEDNADVRSYSTMVLAELGYHVLEVGDAESALAILQTSARVDLLFTDVVLPGKSGKILSDAARELRPDLRVLYTTGYSRNAIVHHGRLDSGVQLIGKPFTFEQLGQRIRDLLDKP